MAQKQVLQQQLKQTLSPQQLLVVSLLECPLLELENKIQQELEENPALEEGVDHTALNASDEEQMFDEMGKNSESSDDNTAIDINDYLSDDESEDFSYAGGYVAESSDYAFVNYSSSQNGGLSHDYDTGGFHGSCKWGQEQYDKESC